MSLLVRKGMRIVEMKGDFHCLFICFCLTAAVKLFLRDGDKTTCVCIYTLFFFFFLGAWGGCHRLLPGKGVSDTGVNMGRDIV